MKSIGYLAGSNSPTQKDDEMSDLTQDEFEALQKWKKEGPAHHSYFGVSDALFRRLMSAGYLEEGSQFTCRRISNLGRAALAKQERMMK